MVLRPENGYEKGNAMRFQGMWMLSVAILLVAGMASYTQELVAEEPEAGSAIKKAESPSLPKEITNSISMKLKLIPAGEFMMGSPVSERYRDEDEGPVHRVKITKPYYLGVHEVTQSQYEKVMDENPSRFKSSTNPVEQVSWSDAVEFCKKLSEKEGRTYRLPTEAEWEYACRAGTTTPFSFGSVLNGKQANCNGNGPYGTETKGPYLKQTETVGSYAANAWGLYDMPGNVWEWCSDWKDSDYYEDSPTDDPEGPSSGSHRVTRGGCWGSGARRCRSAERFRLSPGYRGGDFGFRVALVPSE
jgi:formylglycine-generating enzyme required for sulfatase activity